MDNESPLSWSISPTSERAGDGDQVSYRHFLRMDISPFEYLLTLVTPKIRHRDTHMRKSISPGERLALTLHFLATGMYSVHSVHYSPLFNSYNFSFIFTIGESYSSLQYLYRVPSQTIGKIVIETCEAIVEVLEDYMKV